MADLERCISNARKKAAILTTYTSQGITNILLSFKNADFYALNLEERMHCLSVYVGFEMEESLTILGNNAEGTAIKLLKYVKDEDLIGLFQGLESPSVVRNNPEYHGTNNEKALIVRLINEIHDGMWPYSENYSAMISTLVDHMSNSSALLDKYIEDMGDEDFLEIKYYSTDAIPTTTEAGTVNYDVDMNDDGSLDIEREVAYKDVNLEGGCGLCFGESDCCMKTFWEDQDPINGVKPFSLILFTNYSKLSMIEENVAAEKEEILAPAIILKYCDDKDFNNVSLERISIAIDVLALATGAGEVKAAIEAKKYARALYEVAQIFSSAGNLTVNASSDPDIIELKQQYDEIMTVWDMVSIFNGTGKMLTRTYRAVKSGSAKRLTRIKANQFLTKFENAKQAGKQIPDNIKRLAIYMKSKIGTLTVDGFNALVSKYFKRTVYNLTGFSAKSNDEFVDIIIHFDGTKYVARIEENGQLIKQDFDNNALAAYINGLNVPSGKDIRLLSCNDLASGKELSQLLNRPIYVSNGWVQIDKLGSVYSESKFVKLENGIEKNSTIHTPGSANGVEGTDFVTLGNIRYDENISTFIGASLAQKIGEIDYIWKTKYPIEEMLEGRSFFEEIMGQYHYLKSSGWQHTADISQNFKGVDFYKGSTLGNQIFAETAVSMKTTITTNVDNWLASAPIQKNINFLKEGWENTDGLVSNGRSMFMEKAEIHIYMPKANITESLKTTWMNKLNTVNPKIKFEIKALEDFIQ